MTLDCGNYGISLIMGYAGFIPSTVSVPLRFLFVFFRVPLGLLDSIQILLGNPFLLRNIGFNHIRHHSYDLRSSPYLKNIHLKSY